MIRTITQYRPGIYLLMARRAAARARREQRMLRIIDALANAALFVLTLGIAAFAVWAAFTFF